MWPSMVTHTQNLCSAFTHPKCTHTAVNTHTHREHTPGAVGSHLCCGTRGAVVGSVLKGTSVVVLRVKRALYIHSPPPTIPVGPRLELPTFGLRVRLSNH